MVENKAIWRSALRKQSSAARGLHRLTTRLLVTKMRLAKTAVAVPARTLRRAYCFDGGGMTDVCPSLIQFLSANNVVLGENTIFQVFMCCEPLYY